MNNKVITKGEKKNGIVVAKGYRTAAATFTDKIYYKEVRGWMLDVERDIKAGRSVALEDLFYIVNRANVGLADRQRAVKEAVKEYVVNYYMKGSKKVA